MAEQFRAGSNLDDIYKHRSAMIDRLQELVATDPRPRIWSTWTQRALERPWLGVGFGKQLPRIYHQPRHPGDPVLADIQMGMHAHNLFLNTVLQTGIVGLLLLLWLLGTLFTRFYRVRLESPIPAWAGIALLAAMLVKNFTDDFMRDAVAMYFWSLAGWLLACAERETGSPPSPCPPSA
jgi:O-antigen ligase